MDYIEVFQAMLADMRSDLRHWLRGNKEQYLCTETADGKDANAVNRLRLCYALAYSEKEIPEREQTVRALFDAALAAAEKTGGGSDALVLLTAMLKEAGNPEPELLYRARMAAGSGYDPAKCRIVPPEEYSLEDCMKAAASTGMTSYLFTLLICASRMYDDETVRRLRERYAVNGRGV
ncbi:MAG: hypothetical protein IKH27_04865 [Oscillospiraceae bacterium]|nr:hypothetical protein [Oscillospiraceae bacterium]